MSDTTPMTSDVSESGALTVNEAASAFLGLMEPADVAEQGDTEQETSQEEVQAQGESEAEEAEDEANEQEESDESEEPRYRVKAAGKEREVTLSELIKSYQLGQDYDKKVAHVAEERKAVEQERAAVSEAKQLRDAYAQRLQAMEQMLQAQMPEENLDYLKETDPIGYAVKVAELSQKEKQLSALRAEQQRVQAQQEADRMQQLQTVVAEESRKLVEAIPDLADADKGAALKRDIREYGKKLGWGEQELAAVYDSRAVLTLYKAMQYDRLMASKPEVTKRVAEAPKVLKAGTSVSRGDTDARLTNKLKAQAKLSGKVSDAAAVFERFL